MKVSQKQIAEKVGVSISLVSRVLSGHADEIGIASQTIQAVEEAAHQMGYIPNAAALSLKGKSTRTLGVVVYDFKDPFFGTVVHHLQALAFEGGYTLVLAGFRNRVPDDRELQPLLKFNLDGIIAVGSDLSEDWMSRFDSLPRARIGVGNDAVESLKVAADDYAGYTRLIDYIKGLGLSRIRFLGADAAIHRKRSESFKKAAVGLEVDLLFDSNPQHSSFETGETLAGQCIGKGLPELLVCGNDRIAMGAIHAASDAGIRVPEEVRVVGYDDIPAAAQFLPPLTTIRQPIPAVTKAVFDAVISGACPNETRLFMPELIVRYSA